MTTWTQVLHSVVDVPLPQRRPVALARGEILRLTGARGASVRVAAGRVWITEERRRDDVVLAASGQHRIASRGHVVVAAEHRSRVVVEWPAGAAAPRIEVAPAEGAPGRLLGAGDSALSTLTAWVSAWRFLAARAIAPSNLLPDAVRDRLAASVPQLRA